jgi:hypothetical protein
MLFTAKEAVAAYVTLKLTVFPTPEPEVIVVPTEADSATVGVNADVWNSFEFFEVNTTVAE